MKPTNPFPQISDMISGKKDNQVINIINNNKPESKLLNQEIKMKKVR